MKKMILMATCSFGLMKGTMAQDLPQLSKDSIEKTVSAMTLSEKISLLVGSGDDDMPKTADSIPPAVIGNTQKIVPGAAGITHAVPRLGIPSIVLADGPAGLRISPFRKGTDSTFYCTQFPIATSLASTWNTKLIKSVGRTMGNEAREYGVDILLTPATNIMRNPLCGRNFEYFSEDPVLSGKSAAAMITGIQQNKVGTSLKHFALNNQETNRREYNAQVSPAALHELYLKPFEIAVREAKPWTVMSSYNRLNGTYTSESPALLDTLLRKKWGFRGIVMSDWFGGTNPVKQMYAGNDLLMPGLKKQQCGINDAVISGKLPASVIDRNVKRVLKLITKTPRFQKQTYTNRPDLKAHAPVSRSAASEGMVLLKNEGNTLPLDVTSSCKVAAFGISSYDLIPGGKGSGDVNSAYTVSLAKGLENAGLKINAELEEMYRQYIKQESAKLPAYEMEKTIPRVNEMQIHNSAIQRLAQSQDIAIITLGRLSGEGIDRDIKDDFLLTGTEQELINKVCQAFHEQKKKVIVILNVCGVIETASWKEQPDAILVSWLAGQEGGNAICDILTGKVTPSGKLPMTWPIKYEDVPSASGFPVKGSDANQDTVRYKEGLFVGYRYYDTYRKPVSYPFGYGLSYTTFDYDNLTISQKEDSVLISCRITNTGNMKGKETVQVYTSIPGMKDNRPRKELKGFAKTRELPPGQTENITVSIPVSYLDQYDEITGTWKLPARTFRFHIGASSADMRLSKEYTLKQGE